MYLLPVLLCLKANHVVDLFKTFDLKRSGQLQDMHSKTNMICFFQTKPDLL